ncbi:MAG: peptidoglycan DD-metalloendopeptidase family protein [Proteobacteria bacterium]|nr:peptidoglycan DD-metalloendopeptidase family protein [Pseudomonadota bacterium]
MITYFQKILLILPAAFILSAFANETSSNEVKKSLLDVQKQLQKLEKSIYHDKKEEKILLNELANLDKEIGQASENLVLLQNTMIEHTKNLTILQNEEAKLQLTTKQQQKALAQLLQSTFMHYRKEKFKLLFEQQALPLLSRQNQYYEFFSNARAAQIHSLQNYLKRIQRLQDNIQTSKNEMQQLSEKHLKDMDLLLQAKEKRKLVLRALAQKLSNEAKALGQLQQQEQHLKQVFQTIQKKIATTPTYIEPVQDFAKAKHKLSLPISSKDAELIALPNFKASKKSYIKAPNGTPVNAIYPGRIVFAEWLRGLGLLIIVDHGHGYMSLYGNNQKLYKGLGDWVKEGEMIASVGQSGTHAQGGLYFEIRKDGEALDPTPWFNQA